MKTAAEILTWCVENNKKDDFTIIANFAGHVNMLNIYVYIGVYKNSKSICLGYALTDSQESLDALFDRAKTLKHYNDQSSQWADELAANKKQCEIAKLKLKLSELEG